MGNIVDLWNMGIISPVYQRISLIHCHDEINLIYCELL